MIARMGVVDPNSTFPSRSELSLDTKALRDAIANVSADVAAASDLDQSLVNVWTSYASEVSSWDSGPDFLIHIVNSTWLAELVDYEKRFNELLSQLEGAGLDTAVQAFTFGSNPTLPDKILDAGESTVSGVAQAVGGAAKTALDIPKVLAGDVTTILVVGGVLVAGILGYLIYESGRTVRHTGLKLV